MSHEPEDLISPEDEAEIQRGAIRGKVTDDLVIIKRIVDTMIAHPEAVEPEGHQLLGEMLALYEAYMKQQGIGLPQPDID